MQPNRWRTRSHAVIRGQKNHVQSVLGGVETARRDGEAREGERMRGRKRGCERGSGMGETCALKASGTCLSLEGMDGASGRTVHGYSDDNGPVCTL